MRSSIIIVLTLTTLAIGFNHQVVAQEAESLAKSEVWKVGTNAFPPFVFLDENGEVNKGYSIELWQEISNELDINYKFVVFDGVQESLQAIEAAEIDGAIAGISITAEREEAINFSHSDYRRLWRQVPYGKIRKVNRSSLDVRWLVGGSLFHFCCHR
ncbi:MAG: transporter substrate-binding domain-containing protein [Spirulinaceae cyanobacterium]